MRLSVAALLAGTVVALSVSACTMSRIAACTPVQELTFSLVYPIDFATAVPDAPAPIVFQQNDPAAVLNGARLVLTPPSGPAVMSGPPGSAPSPLPTPHASPAPGTKLVGFVVPTLSSGTNYSVSFKGTYTVTGGFCPGTFPISSSGSFTTK